MYFIFNFLLIYTLPLSYNTKVDSIVVIKWTTYLKLIQSQLPFRIVDILTYPFPFKRAFAFLNFLYPLTYYFSFARLISNSNY